MKDLEIMRGFATPGERAYKREDKKIVSTNPIERDFLARRELKTFNGSVSETAIVSQDDTALSVQGPKYMLDSVEELLSHYGFAKEQPISTSATVVQASPIRAQAELPQQS